MKEFIMYESFNNVAQLARYLTILKIPKRKIISITHTGERYVLLYHTTLRKVKRNNQILRDKNF